MHQASAFALDTRDDNHTELACSLRTARLEYCRTEKGEGDEIIENACKRVVRNCKSKRLLFGLSGPEHACQTRAMIRFRGRDRVSVLEAIHCPKSTRTCVATLICRLDVPVVVLGCFHEETHYCRYSRRELYKVGVTQTRKMNTMQSSEATGYRGFG